jgi:hypothetical protein
MAAALADLDRQRCGALWPAARDGAAAEAEVYPWHGRPRPGGLGLLGRMGPYKRAQQSLEITCTALYVLLFKTIIPNKTAPKPYEHPHRNAPHRVSNHCHIYQLSCSRPKILVRT